MAQIWSLIKPKYTFNYPFDPSFEGSNGTTLVGWSVAGVGTTAPTTDSSTVKYGLKSLKVTGPKYVYQAINGLTSGATYRASVWAFLVSGSGTLTCWNNGGTNVINTNITTPGQWLRYEMDFTCFSDGIIDLILQANDSTSVIYFDAAQLELKDTGDISVNGSLDQWAGGTPIGWTSSSTVAVTQVTSPIYAGYSAARITGTGTQLSQNTQVQPNGTVLTISFYYRASGAASLLTITDALSANQINYTLPDTGGVYRQFTATKTVVTQTASIIFSTNDNTTVLYVDSVTITPPGWWSNAATTYIDGDLIEEGGSWAGGAANRFISGSIRTDNNRRAGAIYNLDAFNTAVTGYEDFAYAPIRVVAANYSTQDGGQYQTSFINPRPLKIDLFIDGATAQDLGHQREGIKEALKLDLTQTRQECSLVYLGYGSMPPKVIRGAWLGGLQGKVQKSDTGFFQEPQLQFQCEDPYYYGFGNNATSLYATQSLTVSGIIGKINNSWTNFGGGVSGNGSNVYVTRADYQGNVYVGGSFTIIGSLTTTSIAKINLATGAITGWGVGLSANGVINDIYVHTNGDVYVVGSFTSINGVAANNVAVLSAATGLWSALGTGLSAVGRTICFDNALTLYIGFDGATAGGVTVNGFAAYTIPTATWYGPGSAQGVTGGWIYKILLLPGNKLALAGFFTTFMGTTANQALIWQPQGNIVTAFGTFNGTGGPSGGTPCCLAIALSPRGTPIFGGTFSAVANGSIAANCVAEYNGTSLVPVGSGVFYASSNKTPSVQGLYYLPNGSLQVVGNFDRINNIYGQTVRASGIATYTGTEWKPPELDLNSGFTSFAYSPYAGGAYIYAGGSGTTTALAINVNVSVTGTAPTYPKLIFTGPGTLNTVTNATAKVTINFNSYTMQAGEIVTVVFSPLTKTAVSSNNGGTDITSLLGSSDVASFRLLPNRVNQISCYISGTTSTATSATIYYPQVWDSGDGGA